MSMLCWNKFQNNYNNYKAHNNIPKNNNDRSIKLNSSILDSDVDAIVLYSNDVIILCLYMQSLNHESNDESLNRVEFLIELNSFPKYLIELNSLYNR